MNLYYVTFPLKYNQNAHPLFPGIIDGNSIIEIEAENETQAREFITDHFDINWAFLYPNDMLEGLYEANHNACIVGKITHENKLEFR